jgi:O-antigen/teichoic acid export membrane protein
VLVKPFYVFGIDRTVQNYLGTGEYGFYFALFNFSIALQIILDVGLQNFNNREIAQHNKLINKYFSRIIPLKLTLGVAYAFICLLTGWIIGYSTEQFKLLFILIFNQFLASMILYMRSNLSALHYFKADGIISIMDKLLMIVICSVFLFNPELKPLFTIRLFVLAQTASYLITMSLCLFLVFRKLEYFKPKFKLNYYGLFLKKSYPYALLILLMSFYYRSDSILIERLLIDGNYHAGVYAQSFRIIDALNVFGFLFASLLLPLFASMLKKGEDIGQLLLLSFRLLFVPLFIIVVPAIFYNYEILNALYHDAGMYSSQIFIFLMLSLLNFSITYIFGTLLTANGNLKQLNYIAGTSLLLNISLNLILIPVLQAVGAALTSMATQILVVILQIMVCTKNFSLKRNVGFIIQLFSYIVLACAIFWLIKNYLAFKWIYNWIIMMVAGLTLALVSKIIHIKNLFRILQYDAQ